MAGRVAQALNILSANLDLPKSEEGNALIDLKV